MKQVIIRKGEVVVEDVPCPVLQPGSALVEVSYSLISTGTEMAGVTTSGKPLWQRALSEPENVRRVLDMVKAQGIARTVGKVKGRLDLGHTAGYSCSGTVIDVGEGIEDIRPGDKVACTGGGIANHAEIVCVPHNLMVKAPDNVDPKDAASVALGAIAMQGIRRSGVSLGETVVVMGLGLVGLLTVQMLKASGCRVIGVDPVKSRVALAQNLGMDYGIDGTTTDLVNEILHCTPLYGADATIITAATRSDAPLQQAMEITRKKGKVVIVGDVGLHLQRSPFYEKEIDVLISCSYGPGRYDETYELEDIDYPYAYVRWTEKRNMEEYLHLLSEGKVKFKPLVSKEYPIEEAAQAYHALSQGEDRPVAVLMAYQASQRTQSIKLEKKTPVLSATAKKKGVLNVAVIGAGNFARDFHLPNLKRLPHIYSIHAIADAIGTNARDAAERFGASYCTTDYRELLRDDKVDMVIITTRHNLHARIAIEAARARKAVFVEKPMALNSRELDELKMVVAETGVPFMVGFNRRFSPCTTRAKEIIGKSRNPLIINYRVNAGYIPLDNWVHTEEGGGRIIGEACHMFDLLNYFTASNMVGMTASAITPRTANISANDNFTATLKYQDGSICTLTYIALGATEAGKEYIEIYADGKTLIIDDFKSLRAFGSKTKGIKLTTMQKGHLEELVEFARYVKGESSPPIPMEQLVSATIVSFSVDATVRGQIKPEGQAERTAP